MWPVRSPQSRRGVAAVEEGLTLIEVAVALALLVISLIALAAAAITAIRGVAVARANQQAGDLVNAELEKIRNLAYPAVTLVATDSTRPASPTYDGEPLDVRSAGSVSPARSQVVTDDATYTVSRYVTIPAGVANDAQGIPLMRRVTVEVSWTSFGRAHLRKASTIVTTTRRGLPLPNFRFTYFGPASQSGGRWNLVRGNGTIADFGLRLVNLGARDAWNMTATTAGWSYYVDTNQNGLWDGASTEPSLGDSNADGTPDTGLIETNATVWVVAARLVGSIDDEEDENESGTTNTDFRATSMAQPSYPFKAVLTSLTVGGAGATPTPTPTATVTPTATPQATPCTPGTDVAIGPALTATPAGSYSGVTATDLTLYNSDGSIEGDTTSQSFNSMGTNAAVQSRICNFSTDVQTAQAGRMTPANVDVEWLFQPPNSSQDEYRGTAVASVWIQCTAALQAPIAAFEILSRDASGTYTSMGTSSVLVSLANCPTTSFGQVAAAIALPSGGFSVPATAANRLVLRVRSSAAVRLLYDVPGAAAYLRIGMK